MVHSLLEKLSCEKHTRLRYFCSPHHQDTALYPIIKQIERAAKFHRDDTEQQRLKKLESVLALATDDLSETLPITAELLGMWQGKSRASPNLSPQEQKRRLLSILLGQV